MLQYDHTILLANTSIMSHNYHFFLVVRIKIYSFSSFDVYNTVLLITVIISCIISPELIDLLAAVCILKHLPNSPNPFPGPMNHHFTLFLQVTFSYSAYN